MSRGGVNLYRYREYQRNAQLLRNADRPVTGMRCQGCGIEISGPRRPHCRWCAKQRKASA